MFGSRSLTLIEEFANNGNTPSAKECSSSYLVQNSANFIALRTGKLGQNCSKSSKTDRTRISRAKERFWRLRQHSVNFIALWTDILRENSFLIGQSDHFLLLLLLLLLLLPLFASAHASLHVVCESHHAYDRCHAINFSLAAAAVPAAAAIVVVVVVVVVVVILSL